VACWRVTATQAWPPFPPPPGQICTMLSSVARAPLRHSRAPWVRQQTRTGVATGAAAARHARAAGGAVQHGRRLRATAALGGGCAALVALGAGSAFAGCWGSTPRPENDDGLQAFLKDAAAGAPPLFLVSDLCRNIAEWHTRLRCRRCGRRRAVPHDGCVGGGRCRVLRCRRGGGHAHAGVPRAPEAGVQD
jgi:hypothetical protein